MFQFYLNFHTEIIIELLSSLFYGRGRMVIPYSKENHDSCLLRVFETQMRSVRKQWETLKASDKCKCSPFLSKVLEDIESRFLKIRKYYFGCCKKGEKQAFSYVRRQEGKLENVHQNVRCTKLPILLVGIYPQTCSQECTKIYRRLR